MKDDLKDILDGVVLDGITELDDITPDNVEEILGKYNLDKVNKITDDVDISDAQKMLDEAYAAVNKESKDVVDDMSEEELKKLHEDIKKEVKSTMAHDHNKDKTKSSNKLKSKLQVEDDIDDEDDVDDIKEEKSRRTKRKTPKENSTKKTTRGKDNKKEDSKKNDAIDENSTRKKTKDVSIKDNSDKDATAKKSTRRRKTTKEVENSSENDDKEDLVEDKSRKEKSSQVKDTDVDEIEDIEDNDGVSKKASDIFKNLFYNVQDEEYEKEQRKLDRKEKRKQEAKKKEAIKAKETKAIKAEEKKKKQAEEKAAKAKEKNEKKKKQVEAKKKQLENKKQKKAALEKEYENEPVGRINKLGAVVVFMFVGLVLFAIILFANQLGKFNDYNEEAYDYLLKGNYDQAYMTILKLDEKERDKELYEQLRVIQKLNKKLSYYSSNLTLQEREKALDALLGGMELYEKEHQYAREIGVDKQYNEIYTTIKKHLKEEFKLNEKQAKEIMTIKSNETYSEKLKEVCKKTRK